MQLATYRSPAPRPLTSHPPSHPPRPSSPSQELTRQEVALRLKLCRARGEIDGLERAANPKNWPSGPSSETVPKAKKMMAAATAELSALTKRVESLIYQRNASLQVTAM